MTAWMVGIDTGGTFTDLIAFNIDSGELRIAKVPSAPDDPSSAVMAALGRFNPARAVAPSGLGTGALAIGYSRGRAGKATVQYEIMTSSLGGTSAGDGAAMVLPMNHFAPGTPVEVVETEYPVRVERFDLWRDSAGAGEHRGGVGFRREYRFLVDCTLTARTSNHKYAAWGLFGGRSPPTSSTTLRHDDGSVEKMDIMETREVGAGVTIALAQSGGGGYGDPKSRPAEKVALDVADGYVGRDAAAEIYGVAIGEDGSVDEAATVRLRNPVSGN